MPESIAADHRPAPDARLEEMALLRRNEAIRKHFDSVALHWDSHQDNVQLRQLIFRWLSRAGLTSDETVLDIGCGTGLSTGAILSALSPQGRILAVDLSAKMLLRAAAKHADPRCAYLQGTVQRLPLPSATVDRALAFSAWPHFENVDICLMEIHRILKTGGMLHIWHHDSRDTIDEIHRRIGGIIAEHRAPRPLELMNQCVRAGYDILELYDHADGFRLSVKKRT